MSERDELRKRAAEKLGVSEYDLIWSNCCDNPETMYKSEQNTCRCEQGYWVLK